MPTELGRTWLRHLRPRKLDLYVIQEVTGPFLGGVVFFSFIFLMFQALRLADFFIIHGVSGLILLRLAGLMVLSFLPIALPIAFLIGILVGFGRLSADSELVAMKANGISLARLAVPALFIGLTASVLSLALNMTWVPWGDRAFKGTLIQISNTKVVSSIKEGTFTSGFFDLLIYADKHDAKTNRLQKVFIFDEREPRNPLTVIAKEGEIIPIQTTGNTGAAVMLKLYNGNIHSSDPSTDSYQKIDFLEYKLFLKIDAGEGGHPLKPRMVPYSDLVRTIHETQPGTSVNLEYRSELWRRYSVALSPLIFVFLGIGYGTVRTRAVRAGAALITLIVIVVYWAIQASAAVAAQKGILPPFWAMQLPNLVIAAMAVHGFRTASW